jgi:hypothetical protein
MTGQTKAMQPHHLLIALPPLVTSFRPLPRLARKRPRRGHHGGRNVSRNGARRLPYRAAMAIDNPLQGFPQIVEQVPAIRDLKSLRCPLSGRLSVSASAITRDNFNTVMTLQPSRDGGSLAVGQQVNDGVALEVAQDGSVVLTTAPGPLVDTHRPRRRVRRSHSSANQP